MGWSAGLKLTFQIVTWAMTLIVIRILSPDDYGLMAVSQVFVSFMLGFSNLGLGDALIQRADTPTIIVRRVFGMLILVSAALTLLLVLAAYPVAGWYADRRLGVTILNEDQVAFLPKHEFACDHRRSVGIGLVILDDEFDCIGLTADLEAIFYVSLHPFMDPAVRLGERSAHA